MVDSTNTTSQQGDEHSRRPLAFGLLLLIAGLGLIYGARALGKHIEPAELIYELGLAAIIVASIEILLFRGIRRITDVKTKLERQIEAVAAFRQSVEAIHRKQLEIHQTIEKQITSMEQTGDTISLQGLVMEIEKVKEHVEDIRSKVDPEFANKAWPKIIAERREWLNRHVKEILQDRADKED
jgi:hypothetical protein